MRTVMLLFLLYGLNGFRMLRGENGHRKNFFR